MGCSKDLVTVGAALLEKLWAEPLVLLGQCPKDWLDVGLGVWKAP